MFWQTIIFHLKNLTKKDAQFVISITNFNLHIESIPAYHSLEIIEKLVYSKADDVYVFGVIVYEIKMWKRTYEKCTLSQLNNYVMNGNHPEAYTRV